MASPFPGMDPYLEKHWGDIHARLVIYACDQLLIEEAYRKGAYENDLDYREDPVLPLKGADARWAHVLLRQKKLCPGPRPTLRGNGRKRKSS